VITLNYLIDGKMKENEFIPELAWTIRIWQDGDHWLVYDRKTGSMTQGKSYEDAIYMLYDLLDGLKKCNNES
jgi:predicted RNase H-like HicB family nuclease